MVFGVLFYSYTYEWFRPGRRLARPLLAGGFFGALAVILMIARIHVTDGLHVDARLVPVALIGLFEGWPAALIAGAISAAYRGWQGGPGAAAGALAVLATAAVAGLFHRLMKRRGGWDPAQALALAGVAWALTIVALVLVGPYGVALVGRVWLPLLVLDVVGIGFTARLMHDVAERARLAAERERFHAIIDEASDAIRIQDADTHRVLDCNLKDCELSGYRREEMIGRDGREFWPTEPEPRTRREAHAAEARQRGAAHAFGLPFRTRDGRTMAVDSTVRIVERDGRRYEILIFRDAAQREATETARREAAELRAVTLLAGAAAHEINNPLMIIAGSVDLLARQLTEDGPHGRLIQQARSGIQRIKDIVVRMTRITRVEAEPPREHLPPMLDIRKSSPSDTT